MRFAEKNGNRIIPNPLEKDAICPLCKSSVIGKCGKINVWHWAHKNNEDCDNWGGRETEWHLSWKKKFPQETQEFIIENHRADVKINNIVLEFQSFSISLENIRTREEFYGKMKWVLNGAVFARNLCLRDKNGFKTFRWKYPPKTWLNATCPIYVDMQPLVDEWVETLSSETDEYKTHVLRKKILEYSNKLFLIRKVYPTLPCGGWGQLITKEVFLQECKDGYYKN